MMVTGDQQRKQAATEGSGKSCRFKSARLKQSSKLIIVSNFNSWTEQGLKKSTVLRVNLS